MLSLLYGVTYAEAPPGNADCFACHRTGGSATHVPDFSAPTVDKAKCVSCHWLYKHYFDQIHIDANAADYLLRRCTDCHPVGFPARPTPYVGYPGEGTASGYFQAAASLDASAGALHRIHTSGSWPQGITYPTGRCGSCHAPAACTACHTAPPAAHGDHTKSADKTVTLAFTIGKKYGDAATDTYLYAYKPTTTYDAASSIAVGRTSYGEERLILRFPLTQLVGSTPTSCRCLNTAWSAIAWFIALLSLSMIGFGVPAGAMKAFQV
jgi:hypothetical protein